MWCSEHSHEFGMSGRVTVVRHSYLAVRASCSRCEFDDLHILHQIGKLIKEGCPTRLGLEHS
jgi:hypothetical protein